MNTIAVFPASNESVPGVCEIRPIDTLPVDLSELLEGCDSLVITDGYLFPFEALPSPRQIAVAVCFDDRDAPRELWAQYGEVLPALLTSGDLLVVPESVVGHLTSLHELEGVPVVGRETLDSEAIAPQGLAARLNPARMAVEVVLNDAFAPVFAAALAEVPSGMRPAVRFPTESPIRLAKPTSIEMVDSTAGGLEPMDIAVVSFELAEANENDRTTLLTGLWKGLRPGGSLIVVDDAGSGFSGLIDSIASASLRHAVMADLTACEFAAARQLVVFRVRKLGSPPQW